jgi:hypothetical protein
VVIDGKIVVRNFKSLTVDEDALIRECHSIKEHIRRG